VLTLYLDLGTLDCRADRRELLKSSISERSPLRGWGAGAVGTLGLGLAALFMVWTILLWSEPYGESSSHVIVLPLAGAIAIFALSLFYAMAKSSSPRVRARAALTIAVTFLVLGGGYGILAFFVGRDDPLLLEGIVTLAVALGGFAIALRSSVRTRRRRGAGRAVDGHRERPGRHCAAEADRCAADGSRVTRWEVGISTRAARSS
jgi:hypothetical protein